MGQRPWGLLSALSSSGLGFLILAVVSLFVPQASAEPAVCTRCQEPCSRGVQEGPTCDTPRQVPWGDGKRGPASRRGQAGLSKPKDKQRGVTALGRRDSGCEAPEDATGYDVTKRGRPGVTGLVPLAEPEEGEQEDFVPLLTHQQPRRVGELSLLTSINLWGPSSGVGP